MDDDIIPHFYSSSPIGFNHDASDILDIDSIQKDQTEMTIRTVVKLGNRQLSTPSEEIVDVHQAHDVLLPLVEDMKETMMAEGGVGIAAPQIGCNKRVVIFGFESNPRYPDEASVPFTILINPVITPLSNEMVDGWEGCLSVPRLRGLVSRYQKIKYSGYDLMGRLISREVQGFHARVVQHECDHLDGILFPYRLKDIRQFGFEDELDYL